MAYNPNAGTPPTYGGTYVGSSGSFTGSENPVETYVKPTDPELWKGGWGYENGKFFSGNLQKVPPAPEYEDELKKWLFQYRFELAMAGTVGILAMMYSREPERYGPVLIGISHSIAQAIEGIAKGIGEAIPG